MVVMKLTMTLWLNKLMLIILKFSFFVIHKTQRVIAGLRDEMRKMGDICNSRGVLVVADEIHCDFVNKHTKYVPYASIGEEYAMNSFTLKSTSKSFNLAAHRSWLYVYR